MWGVLLTHICVTWPQYDKIVLHMARLHQWCQLRVLFSNQYKYHICPRRPEADQSVSFVQMPRKPFIDTDPLSELVELERVQTDNVSGTKQLVKLKSCSRVENEIEYYYDDVIKWKRFPRYRPFVRGIHWLPVNSPHKVQWRGDLMFSLIYAWTNGWANNQDAGLSRRHYAHYDVAVMCILSIMA